MKPHGLRALQMGSLTPRLMMRAPKCETRRLARRLPVRSVSTNSTPGCVRRGHHVPDRGPVLGAVKPRRFAPTACRSYTAAGVDGACAQVEVDPYVMAGHPGHV